MARTGRLVALLGITLLTAGCMPGKGSLSGVVKYKGEPVVSGIVTAVGSDGAPRSARIQPDGRYEIPGLPTGKIRIAVESPDPREAEGSEGGEGAKKPKVIKGWRKLPDKYTKVDSSGLDFDLRSGSNSHDITLE
jgi:hypothetical protein